MIVKCNLPFKFGDDLGRFIRGSSDKDKRAAEFTSGQTKVKALITCLANDCRLVKVAFVYGLQVRIVI